MIKITGRISDWRRLPSVKAWRREKVLSAGKTEGPTQTLDPMEQKPSVAGGRAANYHPQSTAEEGPLIAAGRGKEKKKPTLYIADDARYKSDSIVAFFPPNIIF